METAPPAKRNCCNPEPATEDEELLPDLPNHLAHLCLARLPPTLLYTICNSWRRLIYSPSFPPFLSLYAFLCGKDQPLGWFSFDPIAAIWTPIPPPLHKLSSPLLLRHPSFIARHLPIQSVSAGGHLVVLAATTTHLAPALNRPLVFKPDSNQWYLGPPITAPRRWCACGVVAKTVYIASGVGSEWSLDVARSTQRWDLAAPAWKPAAPLKKSNFSREAVEAVGWKGKLCMVNMKGQAVKEGIVYDVSSDKWEEMRPEMLSGWTGPAAAMEEEILYVVDEMRGVLKVFDEKAGLWTTVIESPLLKGTVQIAAGGGRVCAVCAGGTAVAVVDVAAQPAKIYVVDPPPATQVVSLHVLPRPSSSEF